MKFTTKHYTKMASGQKQSNQPLVSHRWLAGMVYRWLRAQGSWHLASQHTGDTSFTTQLCMPCPTLLFVYFCPNLLWQYSCTEIIVCKSHSLGEVSKYFTAWIRTKSFAKRSLDEVKLKFGLFGWVLQLCKGAQRNDSLFSPSCLTIFC